MRAFLLLAITLSLALAGCLQGVSPGALTAASADEAGAEKVPEVLKDAPEFCEDNETCDFWDYKYHQYVVYDLDTTQIDVLIVPPAGMTTPDMIATSRLAVQAWSDGIEALAQPWFAEGFSMSVSAVGVDVPSPDAALDPEVIVVSTSAQGILGIGLEPKQIGCELLGEITLQQLGGHTHEAGSIFASDCTGIGFTCFALNFGGADPRGLYDLIAHEVGHCLGAGHVGDALDFRARYAPIKDIMSYQDDPEHVHCVSNMDVRNLEGVYAHLLERPQEEFLPRGSYMEFAPEDYLQVECQNPPGM